MFKHSTPLLVAAT